MPQPIERTKSNWVLSLASIAVVVGALYLAKGVLLPLILAVMFSFLLSPVCDWLERRRLPRVPAVIVTVLLAFAVVGAITGAAVTQMADLAPKIAQYQGNVEKRLKSLNDLTKGTIGHWIKTTRQLEENLAEESATGRVSTDKPFEVRVVTPPPSPLEFFSEMSFTVLEALASSGIVIILVLFFLARREDLRDRFIRLMGQSRVTGTTQALGDAGLRVSRYLLMLTIVNIGFGAATSLGLYLLGVPNAILWGILTAVLKFVPYIGVWLAAVPPFVLSLAITTTWGQPLLVFGVFALLEFICGNFLEPLLFGHHTGVSAVAILVAAVFWSWLWGGIGLLLATPLTVCLLVLGKHVPQLAFLDILLGDEPVLDPPTRIYQRLLAGDQEEPTDLILEYQKKQSPIQIFDSVLIPALCLAELDAQRGRIDPDRMAAIRDGMRLLIDELAVVPPVQPAAEEGATGEDGRVELVPAETALKRKKLLCLTAAGDSQEIIRLMVQQLGVQYQFDVETMSVPEFDRQGLQVEADADLVCISLLPPSVVTHARQIYRRAHREYSDTKLVFGLWDYRGDIDRARDRIGCSQAARLATSLQLALEPLIPTENSTQPSDPPVAPAITAQPAGAALLM